MESYYRRRGPGSFQSLFKSLSSNTIVLRSLTFEMDVSKGVLTEAEVGAQSHSLPPRTPQGPLSPLGRMPGLCGAV